jgi:hypothetical protein
LRAGSYASEPCAIPSTQNVTLTFPGAVVVVVSAATPFEPVVPDTDWLIDPENVPVTTAD